jgi:hypothetical protein
LRVLLLMAPRDGEQTGGEVDSGDERAQIRQMPRHAAICPP